MATTDKDISRTIADPFDTPDVDTLILPDRLFTIREFDKNIHTYSSINITSEIINPDSVFGFDASVPSYTDYTAQAIEDTADDVPIFPPTIGSNDRLLIGSDRTFDWVLLLMGTAGAGTFSVTTRYFDGSNWQALTSIYTYSSLKATGFHRIVFQRPASNLWKRYTINGSRKHWVSIYYTSGTMTTRPLANRIWLGRFEDGELIDENNNAVFFGVNI